MKKYRVLLILSLIITFIAGTFAWFNYQTNKTSLVLSIGDITDAKVILDPYEINETVTPVNTYSSGVLSNVTAINNSSYNLNLKLYYEINALPTELINNGLKYTITSSNSETGTYSEIISGDFTSITDNELVILDTTIESSTTIYYKVYLWLDSSVCNQTELASMNIDIMLNGKISLISYTVNLDANGGAIMTSSYDYTGSEQIFTASYSGIYQLEVWGAQGGNGSSTYTGGYGGYSAGIVSLTSGTSLYVVVGGQGSAANNTQVSGGYNGGGSAITASTADTAGSGGGATHIATKSGLLSSLSSSQSSILIVAGGGGGGYYYNLFNSSGGNGGGYNGTSSSGGTCTDRTKTNGTNATQTSGGIGSTCGGTSISGSFGLGGTKTSWSSGGGGGFYGGGSGYATGAQGGSGYIGNSLLSNKAMYCYDCTTSTDADTYTISTTNVSEEPISSYAKSGNGYAKISLISTSINIIYGSDDGDLPTPTRDGYVFNGWYTEDGTLVTSSDVVNINSDITLYAYWVAE